MRYGKRTLQLSFYLLCIFFASGEKDPRIAQETSTTSNPTETSSLHYLKYTTVTQTDYYTSVTQGVTEIDYNSTSTQNITAIDDYDSVQNISETDYYDSRQNIKENDDYYKILQNILGIDDYNITDLGNEKIFSNESSIETVSEASIMTETVSEESTTTETVSEQSTTTETVSEESTMTETVSEASTTTETSICDLNGTKDVTNLNIEATGIEWVMLSWESPCNSIDSIAIIYLIHTCNKTVCIEQSGSNTQYNVTSLEPCTQYSFIVKIANSTESYGVNVTAVTSDNITEIGDVENLYVQALESDKLTLMWETPSKYPNCIRHYHIKQCSEGHCNYNTVSTTNYIAKNLEVCKKYFFTVKTIANNAESAGVNVTARTTLSKLSAPELVNATYDEMKLKISWKSPSVGILCIKHYRITIDYYQIQIKSDTMITTDTNITIDNPPACTPYKIYINAVSIDSSDGEMSTVSGDTGPAVSLPPTLYIPEPLVSKDSISISWFIKLVNDCSVMSVITVCNYTETKGRGYKLVNGESIIKVDVNSPLKSHIIINTTVEHLSPYTTYMCKGSVINEAGSSAPSKIINATTLEDIPSVPIIMVTNITDSQFTFIWEPPEYLAGNLTSFEISFNSKPLFPTPDWCIQVIHNDTINVDGSVLSYNYLNGKPFRTYTIHIKAKTNAGWGDYNEITFHSRPGVPAEVTNLSYAIEESENNPETLDTVLTWALPCSSNGIIELFNISVHGTRESYEPHTYFLIKNVPNNVNRNELFATKFDNLKGEYNYTFGVSAKVIGVDVGISNNYSGVLYPADIPPQPDDEYVKSITIDPYKAKRSTSTAAILLPLFPNTNGDIKYYAIMISEMGCNPALHMRHNLKTSVWPNISSWEEAMLQDFSIPYQATRPYWDPYPNYVADYGHMKAVKYVLGEDTTCKEISSNTDKRLYCNGPLKPDTWYHVRMRAFTYGGYNDSVAFVIKTNAELNTAIVIGVVFGILFLGILTTMMLLVRKCSLQAVLRRFLHSDMSGSPVPAPFTRKKFVAHCQQLVDNPGKLSNEFRLLQTLSVDLQMPTNSACLQANRKKNRYSDILPYDFSRVKLEVIDNDPNTDYINASFIRGITGEDEYIACQGPKEETTYDFWRMVDQYNVNMIVMLTQLIEKGKEKCHQYFPAIREIFRYESMTIRCTSELDFRTYTQRTLVLQKENIKRNIMHLHFKDWPDHDVPEDFDPMINFCQIVRRHITANKGFVVVHCSAGIGRTGTLIAIDILLQHLRDNRKLDVFGTVYRLRHHRINMVQRESQYAYIYNCIKQVLKNPYFLKTCKPPPVEPVYENTPKKLKDASNSNLVSSLETLKQYNFSLSMDSMGPIYNFFAWSPITEIHSKNNGLRYCKSTGAIDMRIEQSFLDPLKKDTSI